MNIQANKKISLITLIIAVQPILDALAFWTAGGFSSVAGILRLAIMLCLPVYLFASTEKKGRFVIPFIIIGFLCAVHFVTAYYYGYDNPSADIQYMLRVVQMPVLALCFIELIRRDGCSSFALKGFASAALIYIILLILSYATGTYNSTYGDGIGISGWVSDSNRCANSIIIVTLCVMIMFFAYSSEKIVYVLPASLIVFLLLITNGTKACFYSLFIIFLAFAVFEPVLALVNKKRVVLSKVVLPLLLVITAVVIYPYTPRAKKDMIESNNDKSAILIDLENSLAEAGYSKDEITMDIVRTDADVFDAYDFFYRRIICTAAPEMFDRFDSLEIMEYYDLSTDMNSLIDVRLMKRAYTNLSFKHSGIFERIFGFEYGDVLFVDKDLSPENDWPALFWINGYVGFAAYVIFVLYFVFLIAKKLLNSFKDSCNLLNCSLALCFFLQLGLAQFSGAILRRPNVSVYLSVILALIFFRTATDSATVEE